MKRILMIATMAAAAAMFAVTKAEAAVTVTMQVCQTGFGCSTPTDLNALQNAFGAFSVSWGDYTIGSMTGIGTEGASASTGNQTTLTVQRTGTTNSNALEVYLIASGYMLPAGTGALLDSSTGGSATGAAGSWTYQAWYSNTNSTLIPPVGQTNGAVACTGLGGFPGSCSGNAPSLNVIAGQPFSLIGRITLNIPTTEAVAVGSSLNQYNPNGSITVSAVPEPGTMVLLGTGLIGLAAGIRRRMAK